MVARGEIGFLIAALAESAGIFGAQVQDTQPPHRARRDGNNDSSISHRDNSVGNQKQESLELFLIVSWAILLCTVIGPVCVGLCVRMLRRRKARGQGDWKDDWGVWKGEVGTHLVP